MVRRQLSPALCRKALKKLGFSHMSKAGEYPLLRPITVQQAISIGGGLATLGSEWRIKIKRISGNGQTYEVPASLDDQVEAGDTIIVSERIF